LYGLLYEALASRSTNNQPVSVGQGETTMNKQPEITAQTRKNLIDAFWSLYCEKRMEQITIREITARAGYNRGTFYEYFSDVYDVLNQIENSLIPKECELPPIKGIGVEMPLHVFMKLYEQNSMYYSVLLGSNGDPAFTNKLKSSVRPIIMKLITGNKQLNTVEMEYIAEYLLSSMIGILSYWFQSQKSLPAEKLIELMYDIMNNGVMNRLP
jgi:AcrR family transcriptional regulator